MLKKFRVVLMVLCCSLFLVGCGNKSSENSVSEEKQPVELNISAAASLKEVMADLQAAYKKVADNVTLVVNYGGSGSLQQQIEQGAPCDLFI